MCLNRLFLSGVLLGSVVTLLLTALLMSSRIQGSRRSDLEVQKVDYNGDGKPDAIYYYTNGVHENTLRDRNFDGSMDYMSYFSNGIPVRAVAFDAFGERPDTCIYFQDGQVSVVERDVDSNLVADITEYYTNGVLANISYRPNGTGDVVHVSYFTKGVMRSEDVSWG